MKRFTQKQKSPIDSLIYCIENSINPGFLDASKKNVKFNVNGFVVFFTLHCKHSCSGTVMKNGHVVHTTKIERIALSVSDVRNFINNQEQQS